MAAEKRKQRNNLIRGMRKSLRHYVALYDAAKALHDHDAIKAVANELKTTIEEIQNHANSLEELADAVIADLSNEGSDNGSH